MSLPLDCTAQAEDEYVTVCGDCFEEIERVGRAGDSLNWCESCQQLEGDTKEITLSEYEAHHG